MQFAFYINYVLHEHINDSQATDKSSISIQI